MLNRDRFLWLWIQGARTPGLEFSSSVKKETERTSRDTSVHLVRLRSHPVLSLKSDKITLRAGQGFVTQTHIGSWMGSPEGEFVRALRCLFLHYLPIPISQRPHWSLESLGIGLSCHWRHQTLSGVHSPCICPLPSSAFYNHELGFSIVCPPASELLLLLLSLFFSSTCKLVVCISSP